MQDLLNWKPKDTFKISELTKCINNYPNRFDTYKVNTLLYKEFKYYENINFPNAGDWSFCIVDQDSKIVCKYYDYPINIGIEDHYIKNIVIRFVDILQIDESSIYYNYYGYYLSSMNIEVKGTSYHIEGFFDKDYPSGDIHYIVQNKNNGKFYKFEGKICNSIQGNSGSYRIRNSSPYKDNYMSSYTVNITISNRPSELFRTYTEISSTEAEDFRSKHYPEGRIEISGFMYENFNRLQRFSRVFNGIMEEESVITYNNVLFGGIEFPTKLSFFRRNSISRSFMLFFYPVCITDGKYLMLVKPEKGIGDTSYSLGVFMNIYIFKENTNHCKKRSVKISHNENSYFNDNLLPNLIFSSNIFEAVGSGFYDWWYGWSTGDVQRYMKYASFGTVNNSYSGGYDYSNNSYRTGIKGIKFSFKFPKDMDTYYNTLEDASPDEYLEVYNFALNNQPKNGWTLHEG